MKIATMEINTGVHCEVKTVGRVENAIEIKSPNNTIRNKIGGKALKISVIVGCLKLSSTNFTLSLILSLPFCSDNITTQIHFVETQIFALSTRSS